MFKYLENQIISEERQLFFQSWLKSPMQLGTFAPMSQKLADHVASMIHKVGPIVEVGSGTGRLTRALIKKDLTDNFATIELDHAFCDFMRKTLKIQNIIQGDARYLSDLIPNSWVGSVQTIVSVIPFMYFSKDRRNEILDGLLQCLAPNGQMLHVTYSPRSPFLHRNDLFQERKVAMWRHIPPAFVWNYRPYSNEIAQPLANVA